MSGRVMMWANYRRGPSLAVPAPFDDNSSPYWWYDRVAQWANGWATSGFTDVLFPNPVKGQSGAYKTGDGYNPFDDYDIGSKNQLGRPPTRFGTSDQLRRAAAICKANGLKVLIDHVMHQRMGGKAGVYQYVSATGTTNGRFNKFPGCFSPSAAGDTIPPYVPVDPVPDQADNFAFGDPLAPVNSVPKGYVWDGLLQAGDWLFRTTGADGARLDDMKGMNVGFMNAFLTYGAMKGKWFFGEYASGNPNDTNWWTAQVNELASCADFGFHYNQAQVMCNDSTYDMGRLANNWDAMWQSNPMKAVPFVESMDTDTDGFATIVFNKLLGYALLLTVEGLPCVYIRDYLQEPDCYGLQIGIDNLVWIAQKVATGSVIPRLTNNPRVYVFERSGPPGCIVALSNDYFNSAWNTVTVQTGFGTNVQLHDLTGRNDQDCWTDSQGKVTFGVPPAANGTGYGVWAPAYLQGQSITPPPSRRTVQDFDGADDLDIPALTGNMLPICRVWAEADTEISFVLKPQNATGFSSELLISGPNGAAVARGKTTNVYGKTAVRGWHTLTGMMIAGASASMPFTVTADYLAPKTLDTSEFGS